MAGFLPAGFLGTWSPDWSTDWTVERGGHILAAIVSADQCSQSESVKMRQRCAHVSRVPGFRARSRFRSDGRSVRNWRGLRTILGIPVLIMKMLTYLQ
jgi:hypothetical protein